jgi:putative long chain acyl-CoA synthase
MNLSATYRPTVSALRAAGIPKSGRQAWYFDTASEQYRRLTPAVRAELSAVYRGDDD